ncbi:hypothetical protein J2Y74_003094 [Pseudomonas migulae]|nr:hypothetical protein [Pseudomonas migulae]
MYWLDGRHRQQAGSYRESVYMSGMGERSREGQRVPPKSQVGFQAASAAVAVVAPSRGRAQVLRSGQPGMDAGLAAHGQGWPIAAGPRSRTGARACRALARHRTKGAKALGYLALLQVTRRKGETNSRRYPNNGYIPPKKPKHPTPRKTELPQTRAVFATLAPSTHRPATHPTEAP